MTSIFDIRDSVVNRGRNVLGEAAKPLYAVVGVGDAALAQVGAMRGRVKDLRGALPHSRESVKSAAAGYGTLARNGFDEMARRGERIVQTARGGDAAEAEPTPVAEPPLKSVKSQPRKASRPAAARKAAGSKTTRPAK